MKTRQGLLWTLKFDHFYSSLAHQQERWRAGHPALTLMSTRKKRPQRSGAKASEKNFPSTVPPGEIMQASCRRAWPSPVVPRWDAARGPGPEPSQALHSVAQGSSRRRGRAAIARRLMRASPRAFTDNTLQLIHRFTASARLPAPVSEVPH